MDQNLKNSEMFRTSHLMILISYTIFSLILIGESLLLSWEIWAVVLVAFGLIIGWLLHIQQRLNDYARLWVYSLMMMATFFFYGIHETSTYDLAVVMLVVIMLFIMTGIKSLVTLCQITYIITFFFDIVMMAHNGMIFDSLIVTRTMLHVAMIIMAGWTGRTIIDKWDRVLGRSHDEIEMLKDGTERLNDFLANLSHEIRTPINVVLGLTSLCLEKEKDREIKKSMNSVCEAGRRVAEQISDILDYSEIDRGKLKRNDEDYMLSSVICDLTAELKPYKNPSLELVIDVDPDIPLVLHSDSIKLKKILRHLIINGIKYTTSGGVYVRFTSVQEDYGINLLIEVTDTGIGMEEEEQERIFEDFYQGDSSRSRVRGGLGLGLSIVLGFVIVLGGFMTVKSEPGKGTTVRVSLPQKVIDPSPCMSLSRKMDISAGAFIHFYKFSEPNVRRFYNELMKNIVQGVGVEIRRVDSIMSLKKLCERVKLTHLLVGQEEFESDVEYMQKLSEEMILVIAANGDFVVPEGVNAIVMEKPVYSFQVIEILNLDPDKRNNPRERMQLNNVRALIVDDEPMNLMVAEGILARYGITTETAGSGPEAIEECKIRDFDIIFMDHMMPGMDGIEAMKRIKSERGRDRRAIPIIALTANAVSAAKEMFLAEGFDGFLSKPIELMELERVMRRVLPKSLVEFVPVSESKGNKKDASPANSESREESPAQRKGYERLEDCGVDIKTGMVFCQDDKEFYRALLLQFADEYEEKRSGLEKAFSDKDNKDYEIRAHALKSTSKIIGAIELSDIAREQEKAAAVENGPDSDKHGEMMALYEKIVRAVNDDLRNGADPLGSSGSGDVLEFDPG